MNKYIDTYIDTLISKFRLYNSTSIYISIESLAPFIQTEAREVCYFLNELKHHNFFLTITESNASEAEHINVEYCISDNKGDFFFDLSNLGLLCTISSRIGVSVWLLILMKAVAQVICRTKIIYKAIVLDLDDTLWLGTLSEDGLDAIQRNMKASLGQPVLQFMHYVKILSDELGIFVAVCTRNDSEKVEEALSTIDEAIFPIRSSIDYVIANHNRKSRNIKTIAEALQIKEDAIVFVDNSHRERLEVQEDLPHIFVPYWTSHQELIDLIAVTCIFERHKVSLHDRNRKKRYRLLQGEKRRESLPSYLLYCKADLEHEDSVALYSRSNQFVLCSSMLLGVDKRQSNSLSFYLYGNQGEEFGKCSALTYAFKQDMLLVYNWAISCGFFDMGLEERILLYIKTIANGRTVLLRNEDTGSNGRYQEMLNKYRDAFHQAEDKSYLIFDPNEGIVSRLEANTNLKI